MATPPLRQTDAWRALAAHFEGIRDVHLRELFADDPARGERLTLDAEGIHLDYSKHRITDETLRLLLQLAAERRVAERRDAMFARRPHQRHRGSPGPPRRAPRSARRDDRSRRRERPPEGPRGARPDVCLLGACAQRRVEGPHRAADPQHRQHRHRRVRPRPRDGVRGTPVLLTSRSRPSGSSRTSTGPTSPRRHETSTRRRRSSSSRPRPSRRSRRSRTPGRLGTGCWQR